MILLLTLHTSIIHNVVKKEIRDIWKYERAGNKLKRKHNLRW